jgi:hypothetical protein
MPKHLHRRAVNYQFTNDLTQIPLVENHQLAFTAFRCRSGPRDYIFIIWAEDGVRAGVERAQP